MDADKVTIEHLAGLGYEPVGAFYCAGELIIGDPGYLSAGTIDKSAPLLALPVHKGNWFVFARRIDLDTEDFDQVVSSVLIIYQGELAAAPTLLETLDYAGAVEAASGQLCIVDSEHIGEAGLGDDLSFSDKDIAMVRDAGISVTTQPDGSFPVLIDGSLPSTVVSVLFWTEVDEDDEELKALTE